jgi:hypothetical protein
MGRIQVGGVEKKITRKIFGPNIDEAIVEREK